LKRIGKAVPGEKDAKWHAWVSQMKLGKRSYKLKTKGDEREGCQKQDVTFHRAPQKNDRNARGVQENFRGCRKKNLCGR